RARILRADLDVCDLRRGHDEAPTLVVLQREYPGVAGQRVGDELFDLVLRLRTVQRQLTRIIGHSDLDLHGPSSSPVRGGSYPDGRAAPGPFPRLLVRAQ